MILQSLVDYYEALAAHGKIARPGWGKTKVAFALELDENGALTRVVPLASPSADGKKLIPQTFELPLQFKRSGSNAPAYFLSDNAQYCLGIEKDKVTEKSKRCFKNFKEYHNAMLNNATSLPAQALLKFLNEWDPENALESSVIKESLNLISSGGNFVFKIANRDEYVQDEPEVKEIWNSTQDTHDEAAVSEICLVTGEKTEIARIHNSVKGIQTSVLSPNGWTLVGFDKEAFWSYGKEQSFNAPVGKYAAFAYTTALNTLLADRDHVCRFGDTTVVFWAENAEPAYQNAFSSFLNGGGEKITDKGLQGCMDDLAHGRQTLWENVPLHPENRFFILGLAPNAARLSVRFFLQNDFGKFAENVQRHYERTKVVSLSENECHPAYPYVMLRETVNAKASNPTVSPHLAGDVMKAVLTDGRYPETLYQQTLLRLRATSDGKDGKNRPIYKLSTGRMQIIKAFLIKNRNMNIGEDLQMGGCETAFSLGRLFCVLENIQRTANPNLNTTIKDRYYNSASSTPYIAFPTLMRLKNNHLKVVARDKPGLARAYENQITEICEPVGKTFPRILTIEEQGAFALGYYHQKAHKKNDEQTGE